jgi:hypothetical protein
MRREKIFGVGIGIVQRVDGDVGQRLRRRLLHGIEV